LNVGIESQNLGVQLIGSASRPRALAKWRLLGIGNDHGQAGLIQGVFQNLEPRSFQQHDLGVER
jgi:hypothetical protein